MTMKTMRVSLRMIMLVVITMSVGMVIVVGCGALAVRMGAMVASMRYNSMGLSDVMGMMVVDWGSDMRVGNRLYILPRVVRDRLGVDHP